MVKKVRPAVYGSHPSNDLANSVNAYAAFIFKALNVAFSSVIASFSLIFLIGLCLKAGTAVSTAVTRQFFTGKCFDRRGVGKKVVVVVGANQPALMEFGRSEAVSY
ncbi:hypothetical protein J1N35_019923 [Gossypium stocksii]|uniref:Uncharacterized protein n=1 Tax=Gossypium stocksii TaxID=47602 RepID=A0A9D3VDA4_9ROSI|nr:hypothetical protein J1N35_019923 [Gossypium stocksii]